MAIIKSTVEWHDLRWDPDDLPEKEEHVMITIENMNGERVVWMNAWWTYNQCGDDIVWVCFSRDVRNSKLIEECMVWYPVIAWAYYPDAYEID